MQILFTPSKWKMYTFFGEIIQCKLAYPDIRYIFRKNWAEHLDNTWMINATRGIGLNNMSPASFIGGF